MGDWASLTERLRAAGGGVRLTWPELEELVGGLPASAARYRAWWSGDRPHVRAWRSAGFTLSGVVLGVEVTFIPTGRGASTVGARPVASTPGAVVATATSPSSNPAMAAPAGASATVLLVGCAKTKLSASAAARDLYVSASFRKARDHADARHLPWFILSAEHGLVAPEEWLAPYDRYLPDTPPDYQTVWGRWVVERLDLLAGPLKGCGGGGPRGRGVCGRDPGAAGGQGRRHGDPVGRAALG